MLKLARKSSIPSRGGADEGFTIVELLIVIVVIAILAAISIVAYTGIQNKAHDSIVVSDLSEISKQVSMIYAKTGQYPEGGAKYASAGNAVGSIADAPAGLKFRIASGSYHEPTGGGAANFMYCTGPNESTGSPEFGFVATSKSRKVFRDSTAVGRGEVSVITVPVACSGIGYPRSVSYGYFTNSGGWQDWVK